MATGDTQYEGMTLETLRTMSAAAEPGLWWVNDFKVEGGRGLYTAYGLANPMGKSICDTSNGDLQVEHEDDGVRRDIPGKDNMEFAAACVNYVRALLAEMTDEIIIPVPLIEELVGALKAANEWLYHRFDGMPVAGADDLRIRVNNVLTKYAAEFAR